MNEAGQSKIVFRPWVGTTFDRSKVRLLILGESHYGDPHEELAQSTTTVVEKWQSGEWNIRYLMAAARLLTGKIRWDIDRAVDLQNCAFYNFVQVMMPERCHRPTAEHFQTSSGAFREVLLKLNPTHVLATGRTLWKNMPDWDRRHTVTKLGSKLLEVGEYKAAFGYCLATNIPHLSIAFSPPEWKPAVDDFLSLAAFPA